MMSTASQEPSPEAQFIAFYLPQFHPIPENDEWWGRGFTEWTNVAKAQPLYPGHYQPHLPADLGFYDLRVPETRQAQAELARQYGVTGFCYWHYWFGNGRRILERPFQEVLKSQNPNFPFCLAWANETWTGVWHGVPSRILIQQTYPGADDHRRHFDLLLEAFSDDRYIRIDGKPLLLILRPAALPEAERSIELFRTLAQKAGLPGLHLVAMAFDERMEGVSREFDGVTLTSTGRVRAARPMRLAARLQRRATAAGFGSVVAHIPKWLDQVYDYRDAYPHLVSSASMDLEYYPSVIPNWDNTPRSAKRGIVLHGSTPELFGEHLRMAIQRAESLPPTRRIVFIKSWNEWAEGNHLEPDVRFGHGYLKVLKREATAFSKRIAVRST